MKNMMTGSMYVHYILLENRKFESKGSVGSMEGARLIFDSMEVSTCILRFFGMLFVKIAKL